MLSARMTLLAGALAVMCAAPEIARGSEKEGAQVKRVSPSQLVRADRVLIIGHRGASAYAPENTLASFRLAVKQRADMVEDDYHATKDGKLIVLHDFTVDRTTDAVKKWGGKKIFVKDKTLKELRELDAGSWKGAKFAGEKLPTFGEAVEVMLTGAMPLLERKGGSAEQTLDELKRLKAVDKVVVQSFDWRFLMDLHKLEPTIVLGALGSGKLAPRIRAAKRTGAAVVGWDYEDLDAENVRQCHDAGLKVWAYTVDDPASIKRLVKMGVDGIISNKPDVARKVVEGMK